jgi:hypothetical protein
LELSEGVLGKTCPILTTDQTFMKIKKKEKLQIFSLWFTICDLGIGIKGVVVVVHKLCSKFDAI